MSLRDALRKALNLVVEFDDPKTTETPSNPQMSSTDKLWEELEREARKPAPSTDTSPPDAPSSVQPPVTRTVEQIVRESEGPHLEQIQATTPATTSILG